MSRNNLFSNESLDQIFDWQIDEEYKTALREIEKEKIKLQQEIRNFEIYKHNVERHRKKLEHDIEKINQERIEFVEAVHVFEEEKKELKQQKDEFEEEKRKFELQKRELERAQREHEDSVKSFNQHKEHQEVFFNNKFRILEEELKSVARQKDKLAKQKAFYEQVSMFDREQRELVQEEQTVMRGEKFFVGVESMKSLKKRYKDLLKIYHPDNLNGDTETIKEINREYNNLSQDFSE